MSESSHQFAAGDSITDKMDVNADGTTSKSTVFTFTPSGGGSETTITSTNSDVSDTAAAIKENNYLNKTNYAVTLRYDGEDVNGLDYKQVKT